MKHGNIYIGTSGWHYKHWTGSFYPAGTKPSDQFSLYKEHFNAVEINNSFYRLPSLNVFKKWHAESPEKFLFVVKANRFITHNKKLKDPEESIKRFFDNVKFLRKKLGPILFQLPPSWKKNVVRIESFLEALPKRYRYVFEFRNSTWYDEDIIQALRRHRSAFCIYELAGHLSPVFITADFVYVRLHGPGAGKYQGSYTDKQLAEWSKQCEEWKREGLDVFIFFDNDEKGYAAFNAKAFQKIVSKHKP
ncbi:DUF72 domain-containing protein [Pseudochryseolinea flava]|uniref:DUF72 domain-containing protein n=1 Tax=Pseudochryseolinea flava TaxID=2059302 RepID=A0A364XZN2_9BACT|nr:DUF72 domain-containing protein [Pseudochryseolinea flava]RAV99973.1 DUF72 domain-containing protein [Pseudochryseolinea flava]